MDIERFTRHTWTFNGRHVDVPDTGWSYVSTFEGGLGPAELRIPDHVLRKALRRLPEEGDEVEGVSMLDLKYGGVIAAPPVYDRDAESWHVQVKPPRRLLDELAMRLLFASRDSRAFGPPERSPHNYASVDGFKLSQAAGTILIEIPRGQPHATGDRGRQLAWYTQALVTRIAGDLFRNRDSGDYSFGIRKGDGPDGAMSLDGSMISLGSGGPSSFDRTLSAPRDQIELMVEVESDGDITILTNKNMITDEDITLKSNGAQGVGTVTQASVLVDGDDPPESVEIKLDVSAASGTGRSLELDIQTSRDGGETWRVIGTRTVTGTGVTTFTVSDNVGQRLRARGTVTGSGASFTYAVTGTTSPARIIFDGSTALDPDVTSAELTLNVDSITGTDKELLVEIQSQGGKGTWRTVGAFEVMDGTGTDRINVDNLHKRVRVRASLYGTGEPTAQFDVSGTLGQKEFRLLVGDLRVNGIAPDDTYTVLEVLEYVAGLVGYETLLSGLGYNVLPLDWRESTLAELITYVMTGLLDGWWRADPSPTAPGRLTGGQWSNSETLYIPDGSAARDNLNALPQYDDVLVYWTNPDGVERHRPRTIDPELRYYEVKLADVQVNDDLAEEVRLRLLPDVQRAGYHGRIEIPIAALARGGHYVSPHDAKPGMLAELGGFSELAVATTRITEVAYKYGSATLGLDDAVSHVRWEERNRLVAERKAGRRKPRWARR